MNLNKYLKYYAKKIENDNYTDFSLVSFNRISIVLRFRYAETLEKLKNIKEGERLYGRLHRTNLTANTEYGLMTENVLCFAVESGERRDTGKVSNIAVDSIVVERHNGAEGEIFQFRIYQNGGLINMLSSPVYNNYDDMVD